MPWFHKSLYWNETDWRHWTLFEFHDIRSEHVRHLYEAARAWRKIFVVRIFTRCISYFYMSHISLLSCIPPLRNNKKGGTAFSMVKIISFGCWLSSTKSCINSFLRPWIKIFRVSFYNMSYHLGIFFESYIWINL